MYGELLVVTELFNIADNDFGANKLLVLPRVTELVESEIHCNKIRITRLHSNRMRTGRALTVSPSMFCAGGGCMVPGGAWSGGWCMVSGGSGGGGGFQACTEADPPPCEQNDRQV